ncbi:hypothetical protein HJD18_05470 [Thermoleophilia bacterium SCSIO 60948]|nr:hypothetical protein HJD18_05470 [Thermoleophilia bacterium SCSIO 60948]
MTSFMTTTTGAARSSRSRRRGAAAGRPRGGESLARRIERTWRTLGERGEAQCPVCGGGMGAEGDCGGCGARLG